MPSKLIEKTMRVNRLPHIWCPGCGHGILMRDVAQAIYNLGLDPDKVVIVSGIGCSSRAAGYMNYNTLHTTHGRALAFATGVKLANPELTVICITGDGDCTAIGGNHLIHACRRNIDITSIVFNNNIYGMTGGQYSPTTPHGEKGTTAPYGNIDYNFDIPKLAEAAGATFTGRCTAYNDLSIISSVSSSVFAYKRSSSFLVKHPHIGELYLRDISVSSLLERARVSGYDLGELSRDESKEEYTDMYMKIIERCGGNK